MADLKGKLNRFESWLGQWNGEGKLPDKAGLMVRVEINPKLAGSVIEFLVEFFQDNKLVAGSVSLLTENLSGEVQAAIGTMHRGLFVMCEVPDDPDVLALHHEDSDGRAVTLSLMLEGKNLHINAVVKVKDLKHELTNVVLSR